MRIWCVVVVAACGGAATTQPPPRPPPPVPILVPVPPSPPAAPTVTVATALVADEGTEPPVAVLLDADGKRSIAAATTWSNLAAGIYASGPKPAGDRAFKVLEAGFLAERSPKSIVDDLEKAGSGAHANDPPPSPAWEDEDEEDRGIAGVDYPLHWEEGGRPKSARMGVFAIPAREADDPRPAREATIVGVVGGTIERQPAVVIAAPMARAGDLVKAITDTEGMIGVAHAGTIRRLRLQFVRAREADPEPTPRKWVEVRFTPTGLDLEAVPEVPNVVAWTGGALPADFAASLALATKKRDVFVGGPVDVLVAPDTEVQRLVDVLVALDAAGVRTIGLGLAPVPDSAAAKMRGSRYPMARLHDLYTSGDLDKNLIRERVIPQRDAMFACLFKAATGQPTLQVKMELAFFIQPTGAVMQAAARSRNKRYKLEPALAKCVADLVKPLQFPKPKGGGGVSVSYKITFRQ